MEQWKKEWNDFRNDFSDDSITEGVTATYKYAKDLIFIVQFRVGKPSYFNFTAKDSKALDVMNEIGKDKIAIDLARYLGRKTSGLGVKYNARAASAGLTFEVSNDEISNHMVQMLK